MTRVSSLPRDVRHDSLLLQADQPTQLDEPATTTRLVDKDQAARDGPRRRKQGDKEREGVDPEADAAGSEVPADVDRAHPWASPPLPSHAPSYVSFPSPEPGRTYSPDGQDGVKQYLSRLIIRPERPMGRGRGNQKADTI
ncbi:hypothetical protein VOLCADRAFT_99575 [Volvox carteri f. nagariensis]|uniref:Uncharacterized protein n=1 Tax=Volvox carteri f. nagariensis TaxID=3068 RepID=D8UI33_VOLCA|nr:uncharacterized protein VOLCADRAFT_99575 [Volvox carteri f. nagariensis]EFJ40627.1 hypothetical protein VOLCADRAFT_99575 [Volvox carteri f. nagariensis]|eukprot:XP_002958334.1 hypothetical protein VOLCADRAFT_99575 [Volvox carteri f. nagariensis]